MRGGYRPVVKRTELKDRLVQPIVRFAQNEATAGKILVGVSAFAMLWANLVPDGAYEAFWQQYVGFSGFGGELKLSLRHWVNDLLMALFFLLMGLEIKREFLMGELSERATATLPILAAIGGMVAPAAIYAAVNLNGGNMRGTGVPMATDIAFSLGVLALVGNRVPAALKVFLAAVAIVDDLGAVLVIAIFYTSQLNGAMLAGAGAVALVLVAMNKLGVRSPLAYMLVGIPLWLCTLASGVHATVAGVLLALTIPVLTHLDPQGFSESARQAVDDFDNCKPDDDPTMITEERQEAVHQLELACERVQMPLQRVENALSPWITYLVVPVFALANAGLNLAGGFGPVATPVGIGVMAGLILGKPLGVMGMAFLAIKFKWARAPFGVTKRHLLGVGILTGIGFTMSLFIGELAFGSDPAQEAAKMATLVASVIMGVIGYGVLVTARDVARGVARAQQRHA